MCQSKAIVLSCRPHAERQLRVELLVSGSGVQTLFVSRSKKGVGRGYWNLGNLLLMERINRRAKIRLEPVKVIATVMSAARDLDAFHQLSYVLELSRQLGRLSELGSETFELICEYLAFLEGQGANELRLVTWQLALLGSLGMPMALYPCQLTGQEPNGFSINDGGAVSRSACQYALPISSDALAVAHAAWHGDYSVGKSTEIKPLLSLLNKVWQDLVGRPLKTATFLNL